MGFDAGKITATAELDSTPFRQGLHLIKSEGDRLGRETFTPKVDLKGVTEAQAQIAVLKRELDSLDRRRASFGAGGGGGGGFGGSGGGGRGRLPNPSWMALGIGAAAPLALPAAGLAAGAGASLLGPTAAGGIGLAAFGIAAKQNISTITTGVEKLTKLQQRYNAAATDKQRAAVLRQEAALWKSMDPAQRAAVKNVQTLDSAWAHYKKQLEPQSFRAFAEGSKIATTGLGYMLPIAKATGDEVVRLEKRFETAFKSPFWHDFFGKFLATEAPRAIDAVGTAGGRVFAGLGFLVKDFMPLGHDLEGLMVRWATRFEQWAGGAGPGKFVNWVEKNGPEAAKALEGLGKGVEGLGKGLAPIAGVELKALTPVLNFIGKLGDEHPAVITAVGGALLSVGAGLKVIAGVRGIQGILGGIGGLSRGGGGGGIGGVLASKTPVPVFVTNWEGGGIPGVPGIGGKGGGSKLPSGPLAAVKGLAGPLTLAYLATQGGDSGHNPAVQLRNAGPAGNALRPIIQSVGFLPRNDRPGQTPGDQGVYSGYGNVGGTKVNFDKAVSYVQSRGTAEQIQQLHQLAKIYPEIALALAHVGGAAQVMGKEVDRATESTIANAKRQIVAHNAAANAIIAGLKGIPGALAQAKAVANRGGVSIGDALDAGITIGIRQGSGKINLVSTQIVNGALVRMQRTAQLGSPSKITTQYGKWIAQGLELGFTGYAGTVLRSFDKGTQRILRGLGNSIQAHAGGLLGRLGDAQTRLNNDRQNRAGYISNAAGGLSGNFSLGNAVGANNTVGNLNAYFSSGASVLHRFSTLVAQARKRGLSPALIDQAEQAAAQNPAAGVALLQNILSGKSGSIATLNKDWRAVSGYATQAATVGGNAMFAAEIAKDRRQVERLLAQFARIADGVVASNHKLPPAIKRAIEEAFAGQIHSSRQGR